MEELQKEVRRLRDMIAVYEQTVRGMQTEMRLLHSEVRSIRNGIESYK